MQVYNEGPLNRGPLIIPPRDWTHMADGPGCGARPGGCRASSAPTTTTTTTTTNSNHSNRLLLLLLIVIIVIVIVIVLVLVLVIAAAPRSAWR